ncbi:MAG: SufE family protein [Gemmatimonadota bacterium]
MNDSAVPGSRAALDLAQDEIIEEMAGLEDGLATYEYLVHLGRDHKLDEDGLRTDRYSVSGCQSRVWIRTELQDGHVRILADSDATITRGIIALLLRVLDGRSPAEIAGSELYFLDRTGLSRHLSPARSNGLHAIVRRIRSFAEASVRAP